MTSLVVSSVAWGANDAMPAQKTQIETVVHEYLVKNPEVVVEALQVYEQKQVQQARETIKQTQQNSPTYADALFRQSTDPVAGNPKGTITMVEFFDYQCAHCVDMAPTIDDLIVKNPNLRVVLKEFPIRGPISEFATRAALAAKKQGRYYEFHKALMTSKQEPLTQEIIFNLAKSVGLDVEKLQADMKDTAIDQQIKETYKLAQQLKLIGTPAFFIAKSDVTKNSKASDIAFIPGQVDKPQLEKIIQKIGG